MMRRSLRIFTIGATAAFLEAGARNTWNGCACKKGWDSPGVGHCDGECCNPDNDPFGDWCMVESSACEDSDWGYCDEAIEAPIHDSLNCADFYGWTDKDGDSCDSYQENAWCSMAPGSAVAGVGWHDEWGTIKSFAGPDGNSAFVACCTCGGGHQDAQASIVQLGQERTTWNGCDCLPKWSDPVLGDCTSSCCNKDYDPYGEWCMVADETCEEANWGYCRPLGVNIVPEEQDGCLDEPSWEDIDGDTCDDYADNFWCTPDGGYDLGWHSEWGTFADMGNKGKAANQACCFCGAGNKAPTPAKPVQEFTPSEESGFFIRETWNGCRCKSSWSDPALGTCGSSCCTPDGDPQGDWCMVDDPKCEQSDWGYCRPALIDPDLPKAAGCTDKPFQDSDDDGCEDYEENAWCTPNGEAGIGWHDEWGDLATFSRGGNSAFKACCGCGGGTYKDGKPAAPDSNAERETWSGCTCEKKWKEASSDDECTSSCCNPDDDPFGEWCFVEDEECEESEWGYCVPGNADDIAPWEYHPGGCTDSPGWRDDQGDDCATYRENNWCNADGGYNTGWNEEWGTFASYAGGPLLESAPQACCACGRGKTGDGQMPSIGMTAATVSGRTTLNGCSCIQEWQQEGIGDLCASYCCNPDRDEEGEWCFVDDPDCEESDWGYCLPAMDEGEDGGALQCVDTPGWSDAQNEGCDIYEELTWCTDGSIGNGWHDEWGSLSQFSKNGVSAEDACCICGGGSIPTAEVGVNPLFLAASIIISLIVTCVVGGVALHYRRNYHRIKYASLDNAKNTVGGIGADTVGRASDEI